MPRYIALYKPYGVLSSFTHEEGESETKRTLSEFHLPKGVYAAGRLDFDSEGLLLLSDDGGFIHRVTDPQHKLPKTYWVQVEGAPTDAALQQLQRGLRIKDYTTQPCQARMLPQTPNVPPRSKPITPHGPTAWLEIVLREGKKRQVRHMTAAVGLPTLRLLRVAIGPVLLDGLGEGEWRELGENEVQAFGAVASFQNAKMQHDQTQPKNRSGLVAHRRSHRNSFPSHKSFKRPS